MKAPKFDLDLTGDEEHIENHYGCRVVSFQELQEIERRLDRLQQYLESTTIQDKKILNLVYEQNSENNILIAESATPNFFAILQSLKSFIHRREALHFNSKLFDVQEYGCNDINDGIIISGNITVHKAGHRIGSFRFNDKLADE
ncbi:hypothetical protein [Providencia sp. PROV091]|uniref:hypothetical protein n=1 Tax=Providencia sp. PROV091 TaxID=2949807 RepID=UPI00234A5E83|nr:hypothetical protein [Providencia sp. PROV091]